MKLTMRNIDGTFYTEYMVKTGETLAQIAREQLHNDKLISGIYRLNNNIPEIKAISGAQNISGWTLLLPPIPPDFLAKHPSANKALAELKDKADKGIISAEDYYTQRKLVLSVL